MKVSPDALKVWNEHKETILKTNRLEVDGLVITFTPVLTDIKGLYHGTDTRIFNELTVLWREHQPC